MIRIINLTLEVVRTIHHSTEDGLLLTATLWGLKILLLTMFLSKTIILLVLIQGQLEMELFQELLMGIKR
ncbi:hypothetical protein B9T33_08255 [Acinetobacter sp. ANC 5054]|uniref:Uncharacterized protein n=1 Tax=Acinetobacter tianfuensis TaxID=2419603 RepID=A0A3A8E1W3_9GAMM|nr:hypothetical protein B9T33_08255 [Acinetobacter sp. ANC 5054]RKG29172.1 hypothetical protein D7V32_16195 [Acinetobacter tianfuensis]